MEYLRVILVNEETTFSFCLKMGQNLIQSFMISLFLSLFDRIQTYSHFSNLNVLPSFANLNIDCKIIKRTDLHVFAWGMVKFIDG